MRKIYQDFTETPPWSLFRYQCSFSTLALSADAGSVWSLPLSINGIRFRWAPADFQLHINGFAVVLGYCQGQGVKMRSKHFSLLLYFEENMVYEISENAEKNFRKICEKFGQNADRISA